MLNIDNNTIKEILKDRTTNKNIIWATENDIENNQLFNQEIEIKDTGLIKTRIEKEKIEKEKRTKTKAEVFTPSWICNEMNNNIDEEWFEDKGIFNIVKDKKWSVKEGKIEFKNTQEKQWQDYIKRTTLEITCGEAPFLVSRYDTTTGEYIEIKNRIGLLDRKLRVINENIENKEEWYNWVLEAYKSTYGYEWQGDNLYIARKNLLLTFIEYYTEKFKEYPEENKIKEIAIIISWNIWQMDGLKGVIPNSCKDDCIGCKKKDIKKHNGIYCKIKDWQQDKIINFVDLVGE